MTAEIAAALKALAEANPIAGAVAVGVFGVIAAIILLGRTKHVFADMAEEGRKGTFQEQLLRALEAMATRETAMQAEIAALREQNVQMAVQVELLRGQTRRLIDLLREVRDGKRRPEHIDLPETPA